MPLFGDKKFLGRCRIKRGTAVFQDHHFGLRWPQCLAPGGKDEADNPDMVFDAYELQGDGSIDLRADGYGGGYGNGEYGNGSIFAPKDGVEWIERTDEDAEWDEAAQLFADVR